MVSFALGLGLLGAMGLGLMVITGIAAIGAARYVAGFGGWFLRLFIAAPAADEPVPYKLAGDPYRAAIPRCDKCGAPTLEKPRLPPAPPPSMKALQSRVEALQAGLRNTGIDIMRARPVAMPRHIDFKPGRIVIDCNGVSIEGIGKAGDEVDRALCWQLAQLAEAVGLKFHAVPVVVVRR